MIMFFRRVIKAIPLCVFLLLLLLLLIIIALLCFIVTGDSSAVFVSNLIRSVRSPPFVVITTSSATTPTTVMIENKHNPNLDEFLKEQDGESTSMLRWVENNRTKVTTTRRSLLISSSETTSKTASLWWEPKVTDKLRWQIQLGNSESIYIGSSMSKVVDMYDIDLFDVSDTVITELHKRNKIVICYFSAGTYESYRSDWSEYFPFIKVDMYYNGTAKPFANQMDEWPDERWLDIRQIDLLKPIMISRLQYAKQRKCDGVDPDNMDSYSNKNEVGVPDLTSIDQYEYNKMIAMEAHKLNLSVGLKNDLDQLNDLVTYYDFAINEQCFYYNECDLYNNTFIAANKAVFTVEYVGHICSMCRNSKKLKLSTILKRSTMDLEAWRRGCDDPWTRLRCRL